MKIETDTDLEGLFLDHYVIGNNARPATLECKFVSAPNEQSVLVRIIVAGTRSVFHDEKLNGYWSVSNKETGEKHNDLFHNHPWYAGNETFGLCVSCETQYQEKLKQGDIFYIVMSDEFATSADS